MSPVKRALSTPAPGTIPLQKRQKNSEFPREPSAHHDYYSVLDRGMNTQLPSLRKAYRLDAENDTT